MTRHIRNRAWRPAVALLLVVLFLSGVSTCVIGKPTPKATPSPAASTAPAAPEPEKPTTPEPTKPNLDDRSEGLNNAVGAMASIQSFLEFYFMETGQYPDALEDMLSQYNQGVRQSEPLVKIPTDPATGRKFVYTPSPDRVKYTLRAPDPGVYGVGALSIHQVDWAWMASLAAEQRKKRLTVRCAQFMQLCADVVEQFNKANRNRFPDKLDQLVPKYLQKIPACPLCKKDYIYTHTDRGFEVACPDPKAHGLDEFRFSSTEGLKRYP